MDTSTPIHGHSDSLMATFMKQQDALRFTIDQHFYAPILEEEDDALYRWYPMYIHYAKQVRAKSLASQLRAQGYDCFLHIQELPRNAFGEVREGAQDRSINNIVFVHAMKIQLKLLKRFNAECSKLKFMSVPPRTIDQARQIVWIPDRQMENFIHSATCPDPLSQRIPLTYNDFIDKVDRRVRIVTGPFEGVEGEVKRINRHRIVVALIRETKTAIGITHVSPEMLEFI